MGTLYGVELDREHLVVPIATVGATTNSFGS